MHVSLAKGCRSGCAAAKSGFFSAAGLVLFFIGMYLLSSLIWTIDVKGNDHLSEEQILQAAKQEGLYPFQWSFRLQMSDVLSKTAWRRSCLAPHGSA